MSQNFSNNNEGDIVSNAPKEYFNLRSRIERYIREAASKVLMFASKTSTSIKTEVNNFVRNTRVEARALVIKRHWRTRNLTDNQKRIVIFVDKILNDNKALINGVKKHGKNLLTIIIWGILWSQYGLVGTSAGLIAKIFYRGLQGLVIFDVLRTMSNVTNNRFSSV